MTGNLKEPAFLPRDGTSQKGRALAALDPASVRVDERTVADLVAFAREVGTGLIYYGPDGEKAGNWGDFIGALRPELVAAFLEAPERFDPKTSPALFRPHFTLFLAFLRLFQSAQKELNGLTQRHLDFYYRRVLQMGKKGPVPDRVHLLFDLARGEREVLVAEGSLVSAGPDAAGREQLYRTERPLVVNRAAIAKKSAVFVERRITGLAQARVGRSAEGGLLEMFRLVLGKPRPGDPLPEYPEAGELDFPKLTRLDLVTQLTSEGTGFYLSLSELRDLMRRKAVAERLESTPGVDAGLVDEQWRKVNDALQLAGRRKRNDDTYCLPAAGAVGFDPKDFTANAEAAVGTATMPGGEGAGLEAYWATVEALEAYFYMSAEHLHEVMSRVAQHDELAWRRIDSILEGAYQNKVRADRVRRLKSVHESAPAGGLEPLLRETLGSASANEDSLQPFLTSAQLSKLREAYLKQDPDWEAIYSLLEIAQRNRLGERPAQKEEWLNLHPAADVTVAGARPAVDGQTSQPRWATFGLAGPAAAGTPPPPTLGLAIGSPLLGLREGRRVVSLTLALRRDEAAGVDLAALLPAALVVQASTAAGWVECPDVVVEVGSYAALASLPLRGGDFGVRFTVTLDEAVDPIESLPPKLAAAFGTGPALRLMLRPVWSEHDHRYVVKYQELAPLVILAAHLRVNVGQLRAEKLQNDERALDPKKPLEPFGTAPAIGSRLSVGHRELSGKALDHVSLDLRWMGAPASLKAHYENYSLDGTTRLTDPAKLAAKLSIVEQGRQALECGEKTLVDEGAVGLVEALGYTIGQGPKGAGPAAQQPAALGDDVSTWGRYLQWELSGSDFGHAAYPTLASSKALELAVAIAKDPKTADAALYKVRPPYTPKLKSLAIGYGASCELRLDARPLDPGQGRVLHVHPFGQCDAQRDADGKGGVPFLPRYDDEGELYLGLADVTPPQNVALLFQLAEGSADPDLEPRPITWSYLDGDCWVPFAHRVLRDATGGLVSSGVVELALEPAAPSTRLGGGLYWVRASVARSAASVCDTIDIHPQAVSAVFVDRANAPEHYREPLAPSKIKKLSARVPGLAGVRQPYTSTGGRAAEDEGMWATRVSERLRHKGRALAMWDYERLVLEHFPQVYKARCLPARPDAPGRVELVVIPDIRNLLPSDPFEPKAPSRLLAEIEAYVRGKAPAFAEVRARNARYLPVRVRLAVRFKGEGNDGFYARKLNDELSRFLSPWAFAEGSDITLGGRIYANSIVDFVDRRDYVDYVAGVKLFRSDDGGKSFRPAPPPPEGEGDFVAVDRADAALVAARTHEIIVLRDAVYDEASMSGINFMKVELDFIVA